MADPNLIGLGALIGGGLIMAGGAIGAGIGDGIAVTRWSPVSHASPRRRTVVHAVLHHRRSG